MKRFALDSIQVVSGLAVGATFIYGIKVYLPWILDDPLFVLGLLILFIALLSFGRKYSSDLLLVAVYASGGAILAWVAASLFSQQLVSPWLKWFHSVWTGMSFLALGTIAAAIYGLRGVVRGVGELLKLVDHLYDRHHRRKMATANLHLKKEQFEWSKEKEALGLAEGRDRYLH